MVITIKVEGIGRVTKNLTNYTRRIPRAGKRALYLSALSGQRIIKEEAKKAGIKPWQNRFYPSIRAVKLNKNDWAIKMVNYGEALDRMPPHYVSLKKGRKITKWAKSKGIQAGAIMVHPHPYLNRSFARILEQTREYIRKQMKHATRKAR